MSRVIALEFITDRVFMKPLTNTKKYYEKYEYTQKTSKQQKIGSI